MEPAKVRLILFSLIAACLATPVLSAQDRPSVVASGAKLVRIDNRFQFTEGPASDARGNVYFSDVRASLTYRWSPDGKIEVWRKDTGNANGLAYDAAGNLLVCEGGRNRVVSIDSFGQVTVVADQYRGKPFNQPNDLWIDPQGGVYFSDPIYGRGRKNQDGEHVYYVSPDRKQVVRVIDDLVRPNGLIGTPDGRRLYVSDHGAKRIYLYEIEADGTLSHKRLFAPVGADGMKLDAEGNVYLAEKGIVVFDSAGQRRETIAVPDEPTNLCFAGPDGRTLFITARSAVYTLKMRVAG